MKNITLEELLEAGCHFGHQKRRWNPAMTKYIYGERDGVHIFDLAKTKDGLEKACEFLQGLVKNGGKVLFVATKRQAAGFVKEHAIKLGMPYITVRWMGGFMTNFGHLSKSLHKMADLKAKREAGELKKYTKRERLLIDRDITKLEKFFGGVADATKLPDALFVVDTHREDVAVREAVRMGVPVVGIVDSNSDPSLVDYVIPANDDAVKSIELIVNTVAEAMGEGKSVVLEDVEKPKKERKSPTTPKATKGEQNEN
jgi:small subunit ribosomal protein S2